MVAKTWFATNNLAGTAHQEMSETDPGTEANASPQTGWVVGTGATNHASFDAQSNVASSAFTGTTQPDGTPVTTSGAGDCLRSTNTYNGFFAAANWNVHFAVRGVTQAGAQDGRIRCRLLRGANADGSGATEITAAQQQGGLVTNLGTGTTQVSTATFNPGAFSVNNEYIFIQLAWERTGAGGMTTTDVAMRIGNGSGAGTRVISSDFTPGSVGSASGTGATSGAGVAIFSAAGIARGGERQPLPQLALLLHMDGADDSTTFVDLSGNHVITVQGTAKIDTAQSRLGGASALFEGDGVNDGEDYLIIDGGAKLSFGHEDYTIDFWVRTPTVPSAGMAYQLVDFRTSGVQDNITINIDDAGKLAAYVAGASIAVTSSAISANTWYHVALCRSGGTTRFFVDGTQVGSNHTTPYSISCASNRPIIGANATEIGIQGHNGWIDELRIIRGHAAWTSNFFLPDHLSLLLHMDGTDASTTFTDATGKHTVSAQADAQIDTAQSKFGGASALFDGANDHLRLDGSSDFHLSTMDFTIDCWVRFSSLTGAQYIYDTRDLGAGPSGFQQLFKSDTTDKIVYGGASSGTLTGTTTVTTGQWYHVAVTRAAGTTRLFVNGTIEASGADTTNYNDMESNAPWIGADRANNGVNNLNGWIDELRVIKGHAAWTANFDATISLLSGHDVPVLTEYLPTWPPTALLIHADGADGSQTFIDSAIRERHEFVAVGNAQIDTAQSKFGGASVLFDGTGDWLFSSKSSDFRFDGSFTIDFWVRFNSLGRQGLFGVNDGILIEKTPTTNNIKVTAVGTPVDFQSSSALTTGTWYHVAVTRSASTLRIFVDGVEEASTSYSGVIPGTGGTFVGASSGLIPTDGWIDELRVLKDRAAWTSNFTPPSAPYGLSALANCVLLLHFDGADASTVIRDDSLTHRHTVGVNSTAQVDTATKKFVPDLLLHMDGTDGSTTFTDSGQGRAVTVGNDAQIDTAQSKFGTASALFDGTDFLNLGGSDDFTFPGDFTIDFWVRPSAATGGGEILYDIGNDFHIVLDSNHTIDFRDQTASNGILDGATVLATNTWTHIALTRFGTTMRMFVNGTLEGTPLTTSKNYINSAVATIGSTSSGTFGLVGHLDEFRVIKGRAEWISNFTPPTAPYEISTIAGAAYFTNPDGGTSQFLSVPDLNRDFELGYGDFTIDFWFRNENTLTVNALLDMRSSSNDHGLVVNAIGDDLTVDFGSASFLGATNVIVEDTWHHVAITRRSGTTRTFFDGVLSQTNTTPVEIAGGKPLLIGRSLTWGQAGWIDELRIVKGYAQWTATFTPPVVPYRLGLAEAIGFEVVASDSGAGAAAGTGAASGVGASTFSASGSSSGTGAATGSGASIFSAAGDADGVGAASAAGNALKPAQGSAAGTGAATGAGASTAAATGASSGTGAATGQGRSTFSGVGDSDGVGAASAAGTALKPATGSAAGTGTATGATPGTSDAVGSAAGTGAASGAGTALKPATGDADGVGAASGVGVGLSDGQGQGQTSGTGAATGAGASTAAAAGASSGAGAAAGQGRSTVSAQGSAHGTGIATATSQGTVSGVGSSSGTGAASAPGTGLKPATGSSAGAGATTGSGANAGISGSSLGSGAASAVGASVAASVGTASGFGAILGAVEILGLRRATKGNDRGPVSRYRRPEPAVENRETSVVDQKRPETVD